MNQLIIDGVFYECEKLNALLTRVHGHAAIRHMQELCNEQRRVPFNYCERDYVGVVFIKAINTTLVNKDSFVDVEIMRVSQ